MSNINLLEKIYEQFLIDKDKDKASNLIYEEFKRSNETDFSVVTVVFGNEFLPIQIRLKWEHILSVASKSSLPTIILSNLIMVNEDFKEEAYLGLEFLKEYKKEQFESLKEESISYYIEVQKENNSKFEMNKESIFGYLEYSISGSPFYEEIVSRFKSIYD
ncbi:MAG: hypothetical protein CL760_09640 [Chloroflexi bacterium]|nr:hypothetical protein [Chloroflexota bacterium]|tara:strand:+ start:1706 stop:2188 length:483 start_codon:yes stop_codon:yes gene_type:complete